LFRNFVSYENTKSASFTISRALCTWLLRALRASTGSHPPPDGGYPGGNTAEGYNALLGLTTGAYNTAVGWFSLGSNNEGNFNIAIGAGALFVNITG
jgi:hypothetical protein